MLMELLFDAFLTGSLKILTSAWRALAAGSRAVRRVAEVERRTPGEKHRTVEYVDAFLFPEEGRR